MRVAIAFVLAASCAPAPPAPTTPAPASPPTVAAPAPTPPPVPTHIAGYCFAPNDGTHPTLCEKAADACARFRSEFAGAGACGAREVIYCAFTPEGDSACGATESDCDFARNLVEDTRGCDAQR